MITEHEMEKQERQLALLERIARYLEKLNREQDSRRTSAVAQGEHRQKED